MDYLLRFVSWILGFALVLPSLMVHEVAHGYVALWCGDPTAKVARRLSFNPLRHMDWMGFVVVPALLILLGSTPFGWAKPVPVDLRNTRNPRRALWMVALAGPLSNFVLALLAGALCKIFWAVNLAWLANVMLQYGVVTNLVLMVFNLFPIPPLDGSRVLSAFLPRDLAWKYNQLKRYGFIIILLLFNFVPAFQHLLSFVVKTFVYLIF